MRILFTAQSLTLQTVPVQMQRDLQVTEGVDSPYRYSNCTGKMLHSLCQATACRGRKKVCTHEGQLYKKRNWFSLMCKSSFLLLQIICSRLKAQILLLPLASGPISFSPTNQGPTVFASSIFFSVPSLAVPDVPVLCFLICVFHGDAAM